ncbi:uncharacterized membrane protein YhaH (DUF805 family) [Allocatelliglobosispora scoriae]|uniref:Uncharacterized membrane protein YhaH (DUF805 family) n=1 Tax=Allocatelliglobosispora scoriae TaxID=643052 RepID=A0A841BLU7_9ACTN|nr:DUF6220 domain-containing protein [Allocatelliglobosispora scoriae]MBB5867722.1 uncharacterized membrane protein YhaH (DUF805 family) [Allocatelliglobosispora scoriae]
MRKAFAALAVLLTIVVIAEFFFAASGGFSSASKHEAAYRLHHALGYVTFLLPVAMAIVAASARLPRRLIWMSVLVVGLTSVQVAIAKLAIAIRDSGVGQLVSGLHAVNGLVMLAVVVMIVHRARAVAAEWRQTDNPQTSKMI